MNTNFFNKTGWNKLLRAGFSLRALGRFLQIEPWNGLFIAGLGLLFLGVFSSHARATSSDSVWVNVTVNWDYEGALGDEDNQSSCAVVVVYVDGNAVGVLWGGESSDRILVPEAYTGGNLDVTTEFIDDETDYYYAQWWFAYVGQAYISFTQTATRQLSLSHSSVSVGSLSFGSLRVGLQRADTLTASATGSEAITVSSAMQNGSAYSRYPTASNRTIASGSGETEIVTFTPTTRGTFNDSLIFTTNSEAVSMQRMGLRVSGQGIQAVFHWVYGSSIPFGNLHAGDSLRRTFAFSNTGDDTLFLQTPQLTGSGFSIVSGPESLTLLPNQSVSVVVQYSPSGRQDSSGRLVFSASNGVTAPTVVLSGKCVQAAFSTHGGSNVAFGKVHVGLGSQQTYTFWNSGDDTLYLQTPVLTGSGFSIVTGLSSLKLAPGQTGSIYLQFAPGTERAFSGGLSFSASNGIAVPFVTLTGTGAKQDMTVANNRQTVDLGQVKINTSTTCAFAVTNAGNWDLTLIGASVTPIPFSVVSWPSAPLAAGTTANVTVSFAPTKVGPFHAMLVIVGDDAAHPSDTIYLTGTGINSMLTVDPVNVDFGSAPVQSTVRDTIKLSNAGTANVLIHSYRLTSQSGGFAIVDSSARQVSAGGTASIIVSFRPDAAGNFAGTLTLLTDDGGAPTRTVNLSGIGVTLKGKLLVAPSIDFGILMLGENITLHTIFKNAGQAPLTLSSIAITNGPFTHGAFTTPMTFEVGDTVGLDLTFTPTIGGGAMGSLNLSLDDNTSVSVTLHGVGMATSSSVQERASHAAALSLSLSPNPAMSAVTAHISMAKSADEQLAVFDVAGHEVLQIPLGLTQGDHDIALPIERLPNGSYFVRITNADGDAVSARLIVQR